MKNFQKTSGVTVPIAVMVVGLLGACSEATSVEESICESGGTQAISWNLIQDTDLQLGLTDSVSTTFRSLEISGQSAVTADRAATYVKPTGDIAGGAIVRPITGGATASPEQIYEDEVAPAIRQVGSVQSSQLGAPFDNHMENRVITGRFRMSIGSGALSVTEFRNEVLLSVAAFDASAVSNLPPSYGLVTNTFMVNVSVSQIPGGAGAPEKSAVISLSVLPVSKYDEASNVRYLGTDLVDTSNYKFQVESDSGNKGCDQMELESFQPGVEFYWVLDQSSTMSDEIGTVQDFAADFAGTLESTRLNHRFGVTNMDPRNDGRLGVPPGWHSDAATFENEIGKRATQGGCSDLSGWGCSNTDEFGLQAAMAGLRYMSGESADQPAPDESIRADAEVVIIAMSDENANSVKDQSFPDNISSLKDYEDWFAERATLHAIVGTAGCGEEDGRAYRSVAAATGGTTSSLCSNNLGDTIDTILRQVSGRVAAYELSQRPVSSSLRVFVEESELPRSHIDGFQYFPATNKVAFFGDAADIGDDPKSLPEITMLYEPAPRPQE